MKWLYVAFTLYVKFAASGNPEENEGVYDPDLYEGDMILTSDQRMAAELGLDVDNPLGRGATVGRQWPGGDLVYVIDSSLSKEGKAVNAIIAAMREWISKTCIRFKRRTNETAYVNFKLGSGCSSHVGRLGRRQDINLARGCWSRGIVAHEIGHALGFYHEQSRPDRDNYVTILWDNIKTGKSHNFKKYNRGTIDSLGSPYDYGSVMHYGSKAFSKNGKPTIVAKPNPQVTIGQRQGISSKDAEQMNLLYKSQCGISCRDNTSFCSHLKIFCRLVSDVRARCRKTCEQC